MFVIDESTCKVAMMCVQQSGYRDESEIHIFDCHCKLNCNTSIGKHFNKPYTLYPYIKPYFDIFVGNCKVFKSYLFKSIIGYLQYCNLFLFEIILLLNCFIPLTMNNAFTNVCKYY